MSEQKYTFYEDNILPNEMKYNLKCFSPLITFIFIVVHGIQIQEAAHSAVMTSMRLCTNIVAGRLYRVSQSTCKGAMI